MHTGKKEEMYLISETARLVGVESHVLRYWEEELKLPIRRNELGHRYYTSEDVEQFKEIKKMKEQGLQLKAIRTVLTDSSLQVMVPLRDREIAGMPGDVVPEESAPENTKPEETGPSKGMRFQLLLHNLISQAVRENNEELTREIRETVLKELDYQFRMQEEESRKREQERTQREEEHFRRLDEKLREYSRRKPGKWERRNRKEENMQIKAEKREPVMCPAKRPPRVLSLFQKRKKHSPL